MSPRTGRPLSEHPKTERLFIRVTPEEKQEVQNFSRKNKVSLLQLLKEGMKAAEKK